jgi:salicylate hydroxylase
MEAEEIDVCIVGSGVAGLSAALSLQRIGLSVRVFEKDFDFLDRKQGYGLTLTNTVKGPLSKLGVLDACIQKNCQSNCHYIFNPAGDVLGYYGRELKSSGPCPADHGGNRGNLRIPRQDLRRMLIDQLVPGTILWGRTLQDYCKSDQCVQVTFARRDAGAAAEAGEHQMEMGVIRTLVLIGADGIRSVVRRLRDEKLGRTLVSPIHYLGCSVIIGLSTATHPHINSRGFYVLDGEHRMFTMPYRAPQPISASGVGGVGDRGEQKDSASDSPQLTMWQLSFSGLSEQQAHELRRRSCAELLAEARRRTAGWLDPVSQMVLCTVPGEVWATGL